MFESTDHELMAVLLYLQWVLDNLEYLQNVENPSITIYSDELNEIGTDLSFIPDHGLCDNILGQYLYRCEIEDRKSTRLNSSHVRISYAVFCLKKKKKL